MLPEKIERALARAGRRRLPRRRYRWRARTKVLPTTLVEAARRRIRIDRPHKSLERVRVFRSRPTLPWGNANWSSMAEVGTWTPRLPARFKCARCCVLCECTLHTSSNPRSLRGGATRLDSVNARQLDRDNGNGGGEK